MATQQRRYGIGYALATKKKNSFIQHSLVELARERGIDLICVDSEKPLIDQGPFDCILHKLPGEDWKKQLEEYTFKYPNVFIIDRPEAIERLHNRISMLQVVSELSIAQENETFGIPKQIVVYKAEALSGFNTSVGLKFPVIAKPLVADGSVKSHKMTLVFNSEGLLKLKPPLVLQEFVNHGGFIFKVYVVGEYVKCVKRKSLPDVPEEKLGSSEGPLSFCHVSNVTQDQQNQSYYERMQLEDVEFPPARFVGKIAEGLRKALGLHLFNFDVIRDTKVGNHYLVIDINYFPGYAKMPNYESVLTDFFWKIFHEKKRFEGCAVEDGDSDHIQSHEKKRLGGCAVEISNLDGTQSAVAKNRDAVLEQSSGSSPSFVVVNEESYCEKTIDVDAGLQETLGKVGYNLRETLAKEGDTSQEALAKPEDISRENKGKAEDTSNVNYKESSLHTNADSNPSSQSG